MRFEEWRDKVWEESKTRSLGPIGNLYMDCLKRDRPDLYDKVVGTENDVTGKYVCTMLSNFLDKNWYPTRKPA